MEEKNYEQQQLEAISVTGIMKMLTDSKDESIKQIDFNQKKIENLNLLIQKLQS